LNLSIPSSDVSIPVQDALLEHSTRYDDLLDALCNVPSHARTRLSAAIELADIMETARAALKTIRATLDDPLRVDPWSPNKYDTNKLKDPGSDLTDPDGYFCKHATPKARVLFRITSGFSNTGIWNTSNTSNASNTSNTSDNLSTLKIHARVKRLDDQDRLKLCSLYDSEDSFDPEDYHKEISQWVARFAKWLETKTEGQNEPRKADSRKRKQGLAECCLLGKCTSLTLPANANPSSKRRPIRASSKQATSPPMQPPSVPYRSNSAQDTTNQNMPSYQNQPAQQTVQEDTFRMDNLAHLATAYQGGLVTPIPGQMYYQEQQSSPGKCNHSIP
jgi:hypothetical protein